MENDKISLNVEGVHAGQTPYILPHFLKILPEFNRIIEIGTYAGGLSLFLFKNKKNDCELISYNINSSFNKVPKKYNIDFRIGDCFSEPTHSEIIKLITDKFKRILLLCDGGNKNKEFNTFSQYLKSDDVIMCHDYSESDEDGAKIRKNIGWIWGSESFLFAIQPSIEKYKLSKYHYDDFKSVLWGSFIK